MTEDRAWFLAMVTAVAGKSGCGVPGATVSFVANGRPVNETVAWRPGNQDAWVGLSIGPAIALYRGTFSLLAGYNSDARPQSALVVVPYVDGVACGDAVGAAMNLLDHARFVYQVVVLPDELQTGCGRDGASVVLRLEIEDGPTAEVTTVPWQTLPMVHLPNVDLRSVIPRPTAAP